MNGVPRLERRVIIISTLFALTLFALAALAVNLFRVGLPTCITDIRPFQEGQLIAHSPTHYELHYVARMWRFEPEDVMVPVGSTVDIYVSTPDVTHGVIIPGTNVNLMVVPGVVNYARVRFDKPGDYEVLCHEFCGTGHDRMATNLRVVDEATFRAQPAPTPAQEQLDATYKLLDEQICLSCHTIDGEESTGPTFKGIYGRTTKLTDGRSVMADEAYLREAIMNPLASIVHGYDDSMPPSDITEEQLNQIIEYLKTLK